MFSGFGGAAMALLGGQVPENRLGFALGWMSTAQLLGTLIGPLLGGLLIDVMHDYRAVFWVTSAMTFVTVIACMLFIKEAPANAPRERSGDRSPFRLIRELGEHRHLAPVFVVIMLTQVCALGVSPIVALFVKSMVPGAWLATAAGAAVAVTGLADLLASPWLGKRSDQLGYRRVLVISLIGTVVFTLPQALVHNIWSFLALRFGVGMFIGGILPTANAWIGRSVARERRGQVYGMASSAQFFGMAIGPMLGAIIGAHFGFAAVFETIGLLMLANLIWVLVALPRGATLEPEAA
jgi:DHA1 family multidrug resistance protein-like MFS transporter